MEYFPCALYEEETNKSKSLPFPAVQNITATAITYSTIRLDWSPVKGGLFTYYNVTYSITEASLTWHEVVERSYSWVDLVNLRGMTNYSVKVGLMLEDGFTLWSEAVTSETPEGGKERVNRLPPNTLGRREGWRLVSPLASIAGTCITLSSLLSAVLLFFVDVFIHTNFFEKYKNLQGKALLFDEKSQRYKSSETTTCWPIKNKESQYIRDYNQFTNS